MYGDDLKGSAGSGNTGGGGTTAEDKFLETHDVNLTTGRSINGIGQSLSVQPKLNLQAWLLQIIENTNPVELLALFRDNDKGNQLSLMSYGGVKPSLGLQMGANNTMHNVFTVNDDYLQLFVNLRVNLENNISKKGLEYYVRPQNFVDTTLIDKKFFFDNLPTFVDTNLANSNIEQTEDNRFYNMKPNQGLFFRGDKNSGVFITSKNSAGKSGEIVLDRAKATINVPERVTIQTREATGEIFITSAELRLSNVQELRDSSGSASLGMRNPVLSADNGSPKWKEGLTEASAKPTSSTATGKKGEYFVDDTHFYICTSTNAWRRTALETF